MASSEENKEENNKIMRNRSFLEIIDDENIKQDIECPLCNKNYKACINSGKSFFKIEKRKKGINMAYFCVYCNNKFNINVSILEIARIPDQEEIKEIRKRYDVDNPNLKPEYKKLRERIIQTICDGKDTLVRYKPKNIKN